MPTYETTFVVDATPERVFDVLTDLEQYPEWNPQIVEAAGGTSTGEEIALVLALPGHPELRVTALIEESEPGRSLTWRGNGARRWLFQGYRRFDIEPATSGARVRHLEKITGLAAPLFRLRMGAAQQQSHDALNEAIRDRAELE